MVATSKKKGPGGDPGLHEWGQGQDEGMMTQSTFAKDGQQKFSVLSLLMDQIQGGWGLSFCLKCGWFEFGGNGEVPLPMMRGEHP